VKSHKHAVAAGHICLDIIPGIGNLPADQFWQLFQPGCLINIDQARLSTGGSVSNTGLALHILGIPTQLVAKIGADQFGQVILQIVSGFDTHLVERISVDPEVQTSYSVIINPQGMDRIILHYSGANDSFYASDIDQNLLAESDLFHFGYPPAMRSMYDNAGDELVKIFRMVKQRGVTTSLDMSLPDPGTMAAHVDWREILRAVLPYVDIFAPSVEELLFLLHRDLFIKLDKTSEGSGILNGIEPELLSELSQEILDYGGKILLLKLGHRGAYLRTTVANGLHGIGRASPNNLDEWSDQELWAPCFSVQVAGTTGSGDATVAGLLSAILHGLSPSKALTAAVAVGACNVEAPDALSGLISWESTMARIASGWKRQPLDLSSRNWVLDNEVGLWVGPATWDRR